MPLFGLDRNFLRYALISALIGVFCIVPGAWAADKRVAQFTIGQSGINYNLFGGKFTGGASVDSTDVNGDGSDDIVVGAGEGGGPQVQVFSQSGSTISSFFTFQSTMRSGVSVAAGDLDGDGVAEIVAAPRGNYQPEVQVYDVSGKKLASFLAFEKDYTGGVDVAVLDKRGNDGGWILTASGSGRDQEIRGFTMHGAKLFDGWFPHGKKPNNGMSIAAYWSQTYNEPVIVSTGGAGERPLVLIHGLKSGKALASWRPYAISMTSGVDVDARNDVIVTSPGRRGGPQVKTFNARGEAQSEYLVFDPKFTGGLEVALTQTTSGLQSVATPSGKQSGVDTPVAGKLIKVDLSDQTLQMIENGHVISTRRVSTGKWSTPTPTGTFQTRGKVTVAYSRPFNLYMEYWMGFTPDGAYGLHGLPYWRTASGKLYEGTNHIGTPVSHGCIRQTVAEAKSLYAWAPIGTTVIIQK